MKRAFSKTSFGALALLASVVTMLAQNPCVEHGPFYTGWECAVPGANIFRGALNWTNRAVCIGEQITPPVLVANPTFSAGKMRRWISYECAENQYLNHWETNTFTYSIGPLYFTPTSIPSSFSTPGTHVYTANVDGIAPNGVCPNIPVVVATVTITVTGPLAVTAWKTSCEDKFYVAVTNLSGISLTGGQFDLFVYFDDINKTYFTTLQPWSPTDVMPHGSGRVFTFCSTNHSITNYDCAVIFQGANICAASPKFRIITRNDLARLFVNTTQIGNPCHECGNCPGGAPAYIPPQSRPFCDDDLPVI